MGELVKMESYLDYWFKFGNEWYFKPEIIK